MKENLKFTFFTILFSFFVLLAPVFFMKIFDFSVFILSYLSSIYRHFLISCGMDPVFVDLSVPIFLALFLIIFFAAIFVFILTFLEEKRPKKKSESRSSSGRIAG